VPRIQKSAARLHHLCAVPRLAGAFMLNGQQIDVALFRQIKLMPLRANKAIFLTAQRRMAKGATEGHNNSGR